MEKLYNIKFFLIFLIVILFRVQVNSDSFLGIVPFVNNTSDSTVSDLHTTLFKRLQYEQLSGGIKPRIVEKENYKDCIALVHGKIEYVDEMPFLNLQISDIKHTEKEQKVLPLSSYSIDDVVDLCIVKIRNFIERKFSTKVRVSSIPLDCEIYLNGIKAGKTPAEITLETGSYKLKLEHDFCDPFYDSIIVFSEGISDIDIDAKLKFKGYQIRPFLYSSILFSIATAITWVIESKFHHDYMNIEGGKPTEVFTDSYSRYQAANYSRIGVLNGAILSWTITGFISFKNRNLKKKFFSKP